MNKDRIVKSGIKISLNHLMNMELNDVLDTGCNCCYRKVPGGWILEYIAIENPMIIEYAIFIPIPKRRNAK